MDDPLFYVQPSPITDLAGLDQALLAGLPDDPEALCLVSRELIIHEFLAEAYGVYPDRDRSGELEIRTAFDLVGAIIAIDDKPLRFARTPEQRLFGNCRQFSVLTAALLRRAGIPARCRAGFADYFESGMWNDHWIIERWSAAEARWIRTDAQLDDTQRDLLGIDFDPADLPARRFLNGAEAWQLCRSEAQDPNRFGILDMRGLWFVAGAAIRDLAALNKVETHTWDTWGVMDEMFGELTRAQLELVDTVAEAVTVGDLGDIRSLYGREVFTMSGTVTSQRTQSKVQIPVGP